MITSVEVRSTPVPGSPPRFDYLFAVFSWELARLVRERLPWLMAAGIVVFTALIAWGSKDAALLVSSLTHTRASVSLNSTWGMLRVLPSPLLFLFGALLPFIFTPQVSRELKQHTHELVMTSVTPGWAFVAGRYLAGLVVSLVLATLLLGALSATGLALHLWEQQPAFPLGAAVALWATILVPPIFLFSGLAAALAAWQPQRAEIIKVLLLVIWCMSPFFIRLPAYSTPWYTPWDPTATLMSQALDREYRDTYFSSTLLVTQNEVVQQAASRLAQKMPDLWPWLLPQVLYSLLGLGLVVAAAWRFKRFSNCLR